MPRGTGNIRRTLALWFGTLTLLALVPISGPQDPTTPLTEIDPTTDTNQIIGTTTSLPDPSTTPTPDSTTSTPEPTTPAAACPAGWKEYDDHCYNITIEPKLSWEDAQRACQLTPGGDLLVLNNTAEHSFITQEVSCPKIEAPSPYLNLWIGLHRDCSGDPQIFTWISGVEFDRAFAVWWEIGQPDNFYNYECCADVLAGYCKQSGIFRDENCRLRQGYICEVPKDPPAEVPTPSLGHPQETSSVMDVQTLSAAPYMTSTVELYSTVDATSSLPQPTPSPSVPIEFTPLPSNTPGLSARASFSPVSSDVIPLQTSLPYPTEVRTNIQPSITDTPPSVSVTPKLTTPDLTHFPISSQLSSSPHTSSTSQIPYILPSSNEASYMTSVSNIQHTSSFVNENLQSTKTTDPSLQTTELLTRTFPRSEPSRTKLSSPSTTRLYPSSIIEQTATTPRTTIVPIVTTFSPLPADTFEPTTRPQTSQASHKDVTTNQDEAMMQDSTAKSGDVISHQSVTARREVGGAGLTTPAPAMCRGEILDGLQWAETKGGTAANQQCPLNPFAIVTRACLLVSMTSAIWRPPDYSDCEVPSAGELLDRLTFMSHFSTVDPDDVIKATFQLSQMAAPPTAEGGSNSAQTYSVLVELLEKVAALPSKFTECRQKDMEKFANSFLQAVDNILHPDNIAIWSSSQQVSADSIRIMDAVESFTAQTATDSCDLTLASHQDMPAFFEGKYDHIVFRKSQEATEGFSGLTYSAGTPSATITLPQGVFGGVTDKQVTQLIAMYPTIGQLLDSIPPQTSPSSDSSMQVISSIVTSSAVHQSATAFQTLSVPLCINFTKKSPTYEKEESCVYLGRSDSGDNQWLTDGCWMSERRNGSVHCCCNHMTSFAVRSATETTVPYQLHLLTYVLCSAACFIILLSALILFSVRNLNTAALTVHASLALSVILGFVVIMVGLERTSNQVVCQVLAVATHYILTSQFVWSLEGALQLCFMANSERQEQRAFQLWIYHVIGWGGPVLPVGICAALWLHEYGGAERCWVGDNILVGFISSLGALVLINAMLLVYLSSKSVPIGTTMQNSSEGNLTTKKRTIGGLRSNALMLAMLCLCWGLGIAAFQLKSDVLQLAFAVTALLLGVCFFMMHLIMSHEVRSAILHKRKKSHSKNHTKMKLRQVPYPTTGADGTGADPTGAHHQLVPVQHLDRTDQSLGSTSTSLSQFNTRSTGTNCTDIACDPIHEESYELYRRADNSLDSPAADYRNLSFDQQMLPWTSGRMIQPGPGSLVERSPQLTRGRNRQSSERRHRTDLSPMKRNGNIVLNHKIIRESEQESSLDEDSRDKKRRRKHQVSSVSGSTPSMNMACMPFPMDHHVSRGSRVHPMPLDPFPYGLDFAGNTLMQPQMIYPRIAGFLAQPHRALPLPPTTFSRAPIHQLPMISTDIGGVHRSLDYHGNQIRARDDLYEGPRMVMESGYQGPLYGYNSIRAFDDGYHRSRAMDDIAGPSGYKPRSSRSVDSQRRRRNSEGDSYRDSKGSNGKGQNVKGHKSSSKSRGGRKSKQKTKAASEDI